MAILFASNSFILWINTQQQQTIVCCFLIKLRELDVKRCLLWDHDKYSAAEVTNEDRAEVEAVASEADLLRTEIQLTLV